MSGALEDQVLSAVLADPVCRGLLEGMPRLGLDDWYLTAGAVFQNVWNARTGRDPGHGIKDYDVFYFDADDLSWEAEDRVIRTAEGLVAGLRATVEIRNQARVHLWYEQKFGKSIRPFRSAGDGIKSFASTTCSVGITVRNGHYEVFAPYGLDDTANLHLRPNPVMAPRAVYEQKVREYSERWPELSHEPWPGMRGHLTSVPGPGPDVK